VPLLLLVGLQDGTVAPSEAERVQQLLPDARLVSLPGLGHLAHEEDAAAVAAAIAGFTQAN
jgi:magnesium chelatase accessory protein